MTPLRYGLWILIYCLFQLHVEEIWLRVLAWLELVAGGILVCVLFGGGRGGCRRWGCIYLYVYFFSYT